MIVIQLLIRKESESLLSSNLWEIRGNASLSQLPKYKILKLIYELKTTLALSPEEKENAKKEEQHKVANLTNELQSYKDYSKTITNLLKS